MLDALPADLGELLKSEISLVLKVDDKSSRVIVLILSIFVVSLL